MAYPKPQRGRRRNAPALRVVRLIPARLATRHSPTPAPVGSPSVQVWRVRQLTGLAAAKAVAGKKREVSENAVVGLCLPPAVRVGAAPTLVCAQSAAALLSGILGATALVAKPPFGVRLNRLAFAELGRVKRGIISLPEPAMRRRAVERTTK